MATWKKMRDLSAGDIVRSPGGVLVKILGIHLEKPQPGQCLAESVAANDAHRITFWYESDFQIQLQNSDPTPNSKGDDDVNHPAHYTKHPSGVECITITEHMNFNIGNAIKYLWRAGLKGDAEKDLAKAEWYVKRERERIGKAVGR